MELGERARAWGVEPGYHDYHGNWRETPDESLEAILEALGAAGEPPTAGPVVGRAGSSHELPGAVEVVLEDGGSERIDGWAPAHFPTGYHEVVYADGSRRGLILGPGRCYLPPDLKTWGWGVQLYALRSARSWGMGDFRDLREVARWARAKGAGALLLNPVHSTLPGPKQQPSPYYPSSRCFKNPLYLCVEDVPGASRLDELDHLAAAGRALNDCELIDRDQIHALKLRALKELWGSARPSAEFETYKRDRGELLRNYGTFAALADHFGGGPSEWPSGYEHPNRPEVARWRADNEDAAAFHEWLQFLLDGQWEGTQGAGLVADLAVGVDPEGADAWLWKDVFARAMRVGAPPDEFNTKGQDWGLPPMDPFRLRAAGYEPFVEMLRANMRSSAGIRLDHVMGLFRLFWIPESQSAEHGAYVYYPFQDLLEIVALESARADAYVIGEDLGTVEPRVRSEMGERDMLSCKLLWFEPVEPAEYPELSLAAVTTHDLPTIAGLWTGADLSEQLELGLEPNQESTQAMRERLRHLTGADREAEVNDVIVATYRKLAEAPSSLVIATLEDALAARRRPNLPGTINEHPNWRIPLPVPLEALRDDPRAAAIAEALSDGR